MKLFSHLFWYVAIVISSVACANSAQDETVEIIERETPRLQEIFKQIHQNPEMGFMEE